MLNYSYQIEGGNFDKAGTASSAIKKALKQIFSDDDFIRKIVVAVYEAEINVVAHAFGGEITMQFIGDKIKTIIADSGPGIADITLAMKEGWSTATEKVRAMGFGAGMGLPNMKKNSDKMEIHSIPKKGTTVTLIHFMNTKHE